MEFDIFDFLPFLVFHQ